jgi:hypothetical protein
LIQAPNAVKGPALPPLKLNTLIQQNAPIKQTE